MPFVSKFGGRERARAEFDGETGQKTPMPTIAWLRNAPHNGLSIDMKTPTATVPSHIRETAYRFRNDGPIKAP